MRTLLATLALCFITVVVLLGQAPSPPAATGLVVGSGNFFSPIVSDLEKSAAFYRDGLGFTITGQPSDAASSAPLRNMFGLPDAQLRWTIARPAGMRGGVEIVEAKNVTSHALARNVQDPGAVSLVLAVRDIDAVLARLSKLVTTTGAPVDAVLGGTPARAALVRSPDGHYMQLVQRPNGPADSANPDALVTEVRVRLTVDNVDRAMRLYRDDLGLQEQSVSAFVGNPAVLQMLGLRSGSYRQAITEVPGSRLYMQFIEFKDVARQTVRGNIQDPGSTRMQLQVKDLDAATKAIVRAGGRVVTTGETPVQLPAGRGGTIRAVVVQDPDNLFVVLIEAPRS
jgi:catechol 2,3-dioxygenase-like lactoylglutathione lyase family enzyme